MTLTTTFIKLFVLLLSTSYQPSGELSSIHIEGTSTLHDWVMTVEEIKSSGTISYNDNTYSTEGLAFTFPVISLESGKSAMNTNTFNALNEDDYPNITFKNIAIVKSSGNNYNAKGSLTISGTTKTVSFPAEIKQIENNRVLASGSYKMKMTDFNVEPPEVMWGTISTDDDLTIKFNIIFSNSN